jgi:hypothetical protein
MKELELTKKSYESPRIVEYGPIVKLTGSY